MNVLHICANPKPLNESPAKQLAAAFFKTLAERNPDIDIVNVDLYEQQPPYLSMGTYRCFWYPRNIEGYTATEEDKAEAAYAFEQAELFNAADVLVLTCPLWNSSAPAILKAWIEQVIIPGLTYEYDGKLVVPLHKLKRIVLLVSSGAALSEDDPQDALTPMVRAAFGFIGVTDVAVAWADGQDSKANPDYLQRRQLALEAAEELAEETAEMAAPA